MEPFVNVMMKCQWFSRAMSKKGAQASERVANQADGQLREILLEPHRQAEERIELAVLLPDGRAPLVLYELGLNRNGKSIRGHELGLQHVVIPEGQAVPGPGETVGAVLPSVGDEAGAHL